MDLTIKPISVKNYEVIVVGGGTAGVFAAISAAKSGAKTILIEKNSALGGTMTTAGVNFPGLFYAWGKRIVAGPCWEAVERTVALGGAKLPEFTYKPEKHWTEQIILNPFVYRSVLLQMCLVSKVELLTNTMVSLVKESENGVNLFVTTKEGIRQINANVVIDATGDANVVSMAGYELVKSAVQLPATPQNHLSGYDFEKIDFDMLQKEFENADFPLHITYGYLRAWLKSHKFNFHIKSEDAHTSEGKTKTENEALILMTKLYSFCRKIKGLENLTVDYYAEECGIRETVRIVGEKTLTADDYINGKHFDDSVCYAFYPIDLHVMEGIKQKFFEENKVGEIPYGILIPKHSKRILCAGRSVSTDTDANSAVRVQAPCMAMGQAAGCAAAVSAKKNLCVKDVPIETLSLYLKNIGAIVPEFD